MSSHGRSVEGGRSDEGRDVAGPPQREDLALREELVLSELVNRVLDRGVVVSGEVVISVAGVDLVYLGLDLLLTSVETAASRGGGRPPSSGEDS